MVVDLSPGAADTRTMGLRRAGRQLFFYRLTSTYDYKIWGTDGTAGGTYQVRPAEDALGLTYAGGTVYYVATAAGGGFEVYATTDGTAATTRTVLTTAVRPTSFAAIATDKPALLPGQSGSFKNYTSYSRGLNGVMVDIARLPAAGGGPTADDFAFAAGNTADAGSWAAARDPAVTVRRGAGVNGSDRVTLTWSDAAAVRGQWLRVTVLPTARTGLTAADVFYFGNAPGESGDSTVNAYVDGTDFAGARDNARNFLSRAPIDFRWDYNRDSFVDGTDLAIARDFNTNFLTSLKLIAVPTVAASVTMASASDLLPATLDSSPTALKMAPRAVPVPARRPVTIAPRPVTTAGTKGGVGLR